MAYHHRLVSAILDRFPAVSVESADRIEAAYTILTADLRAFPVAWEILRYDYKGNPPFRLDAWADAIDAAYRFGF